MSEQRRIHLRYTVDVVRFTHRDHCPIPAQTYQGSVDCERGPDQDGRRASGFRFTPEEAARDALRLVAQKLLPPGELTRLRGLANEAKRLARFMPIDSGAVETIEGLQCFNRHMGGPIGEFADAFLGLLWGDD